MPGGIALLMRMMRMISCGGLGFRGWVWDNDRGLGLRFMHLADGSVAHIQLSAATALVELHVELGSNLQERDLI